MTSTISSNRRMLLLIAGIPVTVLVTASWLWFYVVSGKLDLVDILGTANRGTLLSPAMALDDLQVVDGAGHAFIAYRSAPALWRILIPGSADCDEACRQRLHYLGQIHTAMGKYRLRIERVFLGLDMDGDEPLVAELAAQFPDMNLLYTAASSFQTVSTASSLASSIASSMASSMALQPDANVPAYYLVDPNGWIILAYAADTDGKDLMADLKFLLKNSNG